MPSSQNQSDAIKLKSMASNNKAQSETIDFTVKREPRVQKLEEKKNKVQESSWLLSIFKIIITGFIAVALLVSVVGTKLTLVAIGQQFNVTCYLSPKGCIKEKGNEVPYIMMVMIMMIPQFISFVKAAGNSLFASSEPWPSNQAVFWVS